MTHPKSSPVRSCSGIIGGVRVRALYDYVGQETDELSFKAGKHYFKPARRAEGHSCSVTVRTPSLGTVMLYIGGAGGKHMLKCQ